jgi:hypothetical protein
MGAMLDPTSALAAAARPLSAPAVPVPPQRVLVLGGGGALGSAVLEALLASHRFAQIAVVVDKPLAPALRGLAVVDDEPAAWLRLAPQAALIVFDRERRSNGRDEAFARPDPAQLPAHARALRAAGVQQLLVVVPHSPALLPQALKAGLASLDEAAVAALGFAQLVFMRLAQAAHLETASSPPQRLAAWLLRQLNWMVPATEQPVRSTTVARVATELLLALPHLPSAVAATRVLPAELCWQAAQGADVQLLVADWLSGKPLPALRAAPRRW